MLVPDKFRQNVTFTAPVENVQEELTRAKKQATAQLTVVLVLHQTNIPVLVLWV